MSRGSGDISSLIRGNHTHYLLGKEAINELKVENQQLNSENNTLRTDLDLKNIQINALKRRVWEKQNEMIQISSELEWFRNKTKSLEIALHAATTKSAINKNFIPVDEKKELDGELKKLIPF